MKKSLKNISPTQKTFISLHHTERLKLTTMPEISKFFGINEWMDLHEDEILSRWEKAQKGEKIDRIEPLK